MRFVPITGRRRLELAEKGEANMYKIAGGQQRIPLMMETCIFCRIIEGVEPAHTVWESDEFARSMWYPALFELFGWLVIATSVALLLMPWRWHQRFARRVMPPVIGRMPLLALGAAALAAFVLYGVSRVNVG